MIFRFGSYFKEVALPSIFAEPYVFVLMPFKDDEFEQRVYSEIIKPTIETDLGINCMRADERQNASLITDQIYSQIKRANVIIAEITTLNANVLIEIGVALSIGKQVYMLYDNTKLRGEIPFYLSKVPLRSYSDETELIKELSNIEVS